jgi:hypothetical protein
VPDVRGRGISSMGQAFMSLVAGPSGVTPPVEDRHWRKWWYEEDLAEKYGIGWQAMKMIGDHMGSLKVMAEHTGEPLPVVV